MSRSIFHRLGLCAALATLAASCDDGNTNTTQGGGGNGGETSTGGNGGTTSSSMTGGGGAGGGGSTSTGGGGAGGAGGGIGGAGGGIGGAGGTGGGVGGAGGGMGGAGGGTGGAGGGMGQSGSEQIAAVRAAADGPGLDLPVQGVFVTYTKPDLGQDVAGFFVQAEAAGPAIFVAIDPASLAPAPQVGDELEFTVTAVDTFNGLKQVTEIANATVVTTGNPIDPLVTDVTSAADLVTNVDMYESRAIRVTGDIVAAFANASFPQVAARLTTDGVDDVNLRLRLPEAVRAAYDLEEACSLTVDHGVMWRFNTVAQPSVYSAADLTNITCPAPTVVSAVPLSATEVVVTFDRLLDPASVDAADFTFDNGLTATAVSVDGKTVTVTTTGMSTPGTTYTLTVANLNDVLGEPVGLPNTVMFTSYSPVAQMVFNEIGPNIASSRDLVELLVISGGSTAGITLHQNGSVDELLATFPDITVAAGDLIVVHLNAGTAAGAAPGSETVSKDQYAAAAFGANYDGAWDFHGANAGLTNSNRVLELKSQAGAIIDLVPVALTGQTPAAFPGDLQAAQAAGHWLPADCGGVLCTYDSMPTAVAISVNYMGVGTSVTGNSVQRKPNAITKTNADWNAAGPPSWGLPNP